VATLRRLPGPQCEALMLWHYAEWPDAQIPDAMGISRRDLTAHLRRGMSALHAGAASSGGLRDDRRRSSRPEVLAELPQFIS
jgi:DNA-directed RNA polymerase specialized sigma24 family protein